MAHVYRLAPIPIPRPRLWAQLDRLVPLTVLRAPVGFGKTTLVAQWLSQRDPSLETAVWLRVRPEAGDAATFWADARHAFTEAGLPTSADPAARGESRDPVGQVEWALRSADSPVLLIVDGFENVTDPRLDETLLDLLRHTPQLRLMVCLRGHRDFAVYDYPSVEKVVLTAKDLRFTVDETAQLLAAADVDLPAPDVRALHDECGGWPEPTSAVILRLRDSPKRADAHVATAVDDVASDYLRKRLMSEAPVEGLVRFALMTSLPDDFTLEVAELLTDDDDAASHLRTVEDEGVLTAQTRAVEVVYRWPSAARKALREELGRRYPDRMSDLHARLARWYLTTEQAGAALHHAVESRAWDLVITVITRSWRTLVFAHDEELLQAFVALPLDVVATSPRAVALRDSKLNVPDDLLLSVANLPSSTAKLAAMGRRTDAPEILDTCFAVLTALRSRGAFSLASSYGRRSLEIAKAARAAHPTDVVQLLPSLHLHAGIASMLAGDLPTAMQILRQAHARHRDDPRGYVGADAAGKLALCQAVAGDIHRADIWLKRHEAAPLQDSWLSPRIRITAVAARLVIAVGRLDLSEARTTHQVLATHVDKDECWAYIVYARALYSMQTAAASDMLGRLDRLRAAYHDRLDDGAFARPLLAAAEADLQLALGRANLAKLPLTGPDADHPMLRVGRARLALLTGQTDDARRLANDNAWDQAAMSAQRLEMQLILAIAAQRADDLPTAVNALRRAVSTARTSGALRAFTTVPREELANLAAHLPEAMDLLNEPALLATPDLFPSQITLIELTAREQQVLAGLADGLTTQQIADQTVVSYNTVRTQLGSLYKKLGTSSRPDVIARARQLGLLAVGRQVTGDNRTL